MAKKAVKKHKKVVHKKAIKKSVKHCKKACSKHSLVVKKPFNKSQIATAMSEMACLSKKEVVGVIDILFDVISTHLKKRGPGEFTLPGVAKFRVVRKPATKARKGINPFTGEPMVFAAKPARNVVKVRALKKLKDIAK